MKINIKNFYVLALLLLFSGPLVAEEKITASASSGETSVLEASEVELKKSKKSKKEKKKKKRQKASKDKIVNKSKVAKVMAEAWCAKYQQCAEQEEMSPQLCRDTLKQFFLDGFARPYEGKPVKVPESTLSQCKSSVKAVPCAGLNQMKSLDGCEFIVYLNRE